MTKEELLVTPPKVSIAVKLLYAVLGLFVIRYTIQAIALAGSDGQWLEWTLFVGLSRALFWAIIINMIGARRNWARIIFLIVIILSFLPEIRSVQSIATDPLLGMFGLIILALEATAVVFLFQRKSSEWFHAEENV